MAFELVNDTRLDAKLADLSKELLTRPVVPGYNVSDAFTVRGIDETGKPGLFAAVLLGTNPMPQLETLTDFRFALTQRLKQLNTTMPAWPIVVQGNPEVLDTKEVIPGGREYFDQLKSELIARTERARALHRSTTMDVPVIAEPDPVKGPAVGMKAAKATKVKASARKVVRTGAKRVAPRTSARTAKTKTNATKSRR